MKKLTISFLLFLIIVSVSCKPVNKFPDGQMVIDSISVFEAVKLDSNDSCARYLYNTPLSQYDSCEYNLFAINLVFELQYVEDHINPDEVNIIDTIQKIEILSDHDYNETLVAGKIINEVFDIFPFNPGTEIDCRENLIQYIDKEEMTPPGFILITDTPPAVSSQHMFTVKIYLKDTVFIKTTLPIYLKTNSE